MTGRPYNFSAGPRSAAARSRGSAADLRATGVGLSILEISHRSKRSTRSFRRRSRSQVLGGIPATTRSCFPGRRQPVLDGADESARARRHRRLPRHWRVVQEGRRGGQEDGRRARRGEHRGRGNFTRVPRRDEIQLTLGAGFSTLRRTRRFTASNGRPSPTRPRRSSAITRRHVFAAARRHAFRHALRGAQKNLGPSGVTLVVIRGRLVARSPASLASMLSYKAGRWRIVSTTRRTSSASTSSAS